MKKLIVSWVLSLLPLLLVQIGFELYPGAALRNLPVWDPALMSDLLSESRYVTPFVGAGLMLAILLRPVAWAVLIDGRARRGFWGEYWRQARMLFYAALPASIVLSVLGAGAYAWGNTFTEQRAVEKLLALCAVLAGCVIVATSAWLDRARAQLGPYNGAYSGLRDGWRALRFADVLRSAFYVGMPYLLACTILAWGLPVTELTPLVFAFARMRRIG